MRRSPIPAAAMAFLALLGCTTTSVLPTASSVDARFVGSPLPAFRLRRIIEDSLLDYERDPSREAPLFDAALDLQDHFVALGHPDAKVLYETEKAKGLRVVFRIDEGPRVTVSKLEFRGNEALSDAELKELWSRTRSGALGLGDPLFRIDELEALRLSMLADYDQKGRLDAKVDGPVVERQPGGAKAVVRFEIQEGAPYRFGTLSIDEGLPLTPAQVGFDRMQDRTFDRATVAAAGAKGRHALLRSGHAEPRIEAETRVDRESKLVHVRLRGDPGPVSHIESVTIVGNEHTRAHVIERDVAFSLGDRYDGDAVETTVSELYRTGLFRRVEIEKAPVDGDPERLDMTIDVDEIDAIEVGVLAGWGSYELLRGALLFTNRNLFGTGQRLSASIRASIKGEAAVASWQEPHLFGSDTSLTIGSHLRRREEPAYVDVSRGLDSAFQRDLWGPLRGRAGYSLQARDGSDIDPSLGTPEDNRYEIGSIFGELVADRRDSPLYPKSGARGSLKFEHAGPDTGGSISLQRLTWSGSWFLPFSERVVLGMSVRGGAIWSPSSQVLPVQERFYNGGESSVRSFREAQLGPKTDTGVPIGGPFFNTFNVELRAPVLGTLDVALFGDAGNVGLDVDAFSLDDLRYAVGMGVRLVLPIGPLRLDAARNPNPRDDEETWVVHFSVGMPF